jgi:hypothetical protein
MIDWRQCSKSESREEKKVKAKEKIRNKSTPAIKLKKT